MNFHQCLHRVSKTKKLVIKLCGIAFLDKLFVIIFTGEFIGFADLGDIELNYSSLNVSQLASYISLHDQKLGKSPKL